jgi:hypothetical protein
MFEIQHEALREAQREIERLKAQHYAVWLGAGRPRRGVLAAWLRRIWPWRADERGVRPDGPARSPLGDERSA